MTAVVIAQRGRADGHRAFLQDGGAEPRMERVTAGLHRRSWLMHELHEKGIYLFAFGEGFEAARVARAGRLARLEREEER